MDVVIFELGMQRYALPARQAVEIVRAATIAPLPKAPPIVEGAFDYRGTVVPLMDIRTRFRLPPKPTSVSDQFIVAKVRERQIAIRADQVVQVTTLAQNDFRPTQNLGQQDYIAGVATLPDGIVIIHDLETFLSAAESADLDRSLEAANGG